MTPATDGANAPPGNSRFEAIASSTLTGRFFGVPFFRPSVSPALLFNVWAYLLGPFAFFLFGLWRKGIVLLAVGLFLYAPLILPTDASALTDILIEAYTPAVDAVFILLNLLPIHRRGNPLHLPKRLAEHKRILISAGQCDAFHRQMRHHQHFRSLCQPVRRQKLLRGHTERFLKQSI